MKYTWHIHLIIYMLIVYGTAVIMWQENLYGSVNPRVMSVGYLAPDRVTLVDKAKGERLH
jgi:hypothetical protein